MNESKKINPPERSRTYRFPGNQVLTLKDVTELSVSPSGTHRVKTSDKKLHIVPVGWIHIEIDADDWSF
jgi:hypothetical protein